MHLISIRTRTRIWEISLSTIVIYIVWLLQLNILTRLALRGLFCNLPLTFIIVWSSIFTSSMSRLSADDLRIRSVWQIAIYQAMSGSFSGALIGAAFAVLYGSVTPVYLLSYPLIGWICGYFPLKSINNGAFYSIALVFFFSVLGEFLTALQLIVLGRSEVFGRFVDLALPEAVLNALIAPFIFLPIKAWYDFSLEREVTVRA
jgi:rod shape-determining protein MreD